MKNNFTIKLIIDCLSIKSKTIDDMIKQSIDKYFNDVKEDLKMGMQKVENIENKTNANDINSTITQKLHNRRNSQIMQSNLRIEKINSISKKLKISIENFLVDVKSKILEKHLSIDREKLCIDSIEKYLNSIENILLY
jgi:23S rRNA pseudoU1915 N3-methylase RlmH